MSIVKAFTALVHSIDASGLEPSRGDGRWRWRWWNALNDILNLRTNSSGSVFTCRLSNNLSRYAWRFCSVPACSQLQKDSTLFVCPLFARIYCMRSESVYTFYTLYQRGLDNAAVHSSSTQHLFRMFRVHTKYKKGIWTKSNRNQRHILSGTVENCRNVKSVWSFL